MRVVPSHTVCGFEVIEQKQKEKLVEDRLRLIKANQESFVKEIEVFLDTQATADLLAKKDMLNLWQEQVYNRIERQIAKSIDEIDSQELTERLNHFSNTYIEAMKSGKPLFRDVITEAEYDPMESKKYYVKYDQRKRDRTNHNGIIDPLMQQLEKVAEQHEGREHLLLGGGKTSDLPVEMWDKVHSTPHGYAAKAFADLQKPKNPAAVARKQKRGKSDGVNNTLDHYTYPRGAEAMAIARSEAPAGKKCVPKLTLTLTVTLTLQVRSVSQRM